MNWPHIHLMINHFPVILSIVAAGAVLVGLIVRRRIVWVYAAISLLLAGVLVGPAFVSGKEAAEAVEKMPRPPRKVIDAHEEAGETALIVLIVAGIVGAFGWWRLERQESERPHGWVLAMLFIAAFAGAGVAGYAALVGGKIYHGPTGNSRPSAWDSTTVAEPSRSPERE